jgi:hypothetical protein
MNVEAPNPLGRNASELRPATERLEHQLQLASSARAGESQVAWTIFAVFWAAQVLLVGAVFQGDQFPPNVAPTFGLAFLGAIMSIAWGITQHRSLLHLERHEHLIDLLESELVQRGEMLPEHRLTMASLHKGPRARTVMRVCAWTATGIWTMGAMLCIRGAWSLVTFRG